MIKVLHLITDLSIGGSEVMLLRLISNIDKSNFQNKVISITNTGKLGDSFKKKGIPVLTLNMKPGLPNPLGILRLFVILIKEKPDILQTWLYHADLMGLVAGKITRVPTIAWNLRCAELDTEDHPKLLFLILRVLSRLSRMTNAVIVNSSAGRKAHENLGYNPSRWVVIPNGIDLHLFSPSPESYITFRQSLGLARNTPLIGLVARFHPMKDHTTFLKAAYILLKSSQDVHFVLLGKGVDNKNHLLAQQIADLDLNSHVHLLGEREDIAGITAALDIAACSSYSEGFPNTIGEAMACGVPCVVTDVGDLSYMVDGTGKVVPPRDHHAMSAAWADILEMSECGRRAMGRSARERVFELFSLDSMTRKYENLYHEIAKTKNIR